MSFLKKLFGVSEPVDFRQMVANGAVIIDVRTRDEFGAGHIRGAINMPLQSLSAAAVAKAAHGKPVITCCASGMRSASARTMLRAQGMEEVYNGGGWASLQTKLM